MTALMTMATMMVRLKKNHLGPSGQREEQTRRLNGLEELNGGFSHDRSHIANKITSPKDFQMIEFLVQRCSGLKGLIKRVQSNYCNDDIISSSTIGVFTHQPHQGQWSLLKLNPSKSWWSRPAFDRWVYFHRLCLAACICICVFWFWQMSVGWLGLFLFPPHIKTGTKTTLLPSPSSSSPSSSASTSPSSSSTPSSSPSSQIAAWVHAVV